MRNNCDWTRSLMLDYFIEKHTDIGRLIVTTYLEKFLSKQAEYFDRLTYRALEEYRDYYYSAIAYLAAQEEEEILCRECCKGYLTLNGNDHIACNKCHNVRFPSYVWYKDPELKFDVASRLLNENEYYRKTKAAEQSIIDKYK